MVVCKYLIGKIFYLLIHTNNVVKLILCFLFFQQQYRSELGGILALIIIVDAIATFHDIEQGIIELGCDCESGLTSIFTHTYDTPKQPHHDIIHEIRQKLAVSKITWKHRHVTGHQDKHVAVNLLDMWGQLNVEMDSLAKVYWNETSTTTIPFYPHSSFGWSLWIGPRKLSSWNCQELYTTPPHQIF